MKTRWLWAALLLFLLLPVFALADVSYEGLSFPEDAEYIDLNDLVVTDFESFAGFLEQLPGLRQVDMWKNRMTKAQCDFLAERFPQVRWGWTMVIRNGKDEHLIRTDYTSWSTLHNNKSPHHKSEDFSVLKYCWNLMALDIGHNSVTSLDFLYDLPNLRVLIIARNTVEDITPVGSLKKLEYLEMFSNHVRDISPLENLPHLMDLNICFNQIKDLSPLLKLPSLKRLWMYSCQWSNTIPSGEQVDAVRAAFPEARIDLTHYCTNGGWRYLTKTEIDPHYSVILQTFGENHLHPKFEYVPFLDSWVDEDDPQPQFNEPLALLEPQDFSDRDYLLPVDFSSGHAPKAGGYEGDRSYTDSTISVNIETGTAGATDYWVADIRLTDASQIRTMAASMDGSFETVGMMDMARLAQRSGGVLAVNGDYWTSTEKRGLGYIVRQGVLYRNNLDPFGTNHTHLMDVLLIDEDGDFIPCYQPRAGSISGRVNGRRILNAFTFGPILVKNGKAVEDFYGSDRWFDMRWMERRQRMCICQAGKLHYKVICCAGPFQKGGGMTIREFADFVATQDVLTAYNLDGGDSTLLWFNGKKINDFGYQSQRDLTDIIFFASGE